MSDIEALRAEPAHPEFREMMFIVGHPEQDDPLDAFARFSRESGLA